MPLSEGVSEEVMHNNGITRAYNLAQKKTPTRPCAEVEIALLRGSPLDLYRLCVFAEPLGRLREAELFFLKRFAERRVLSEVSVWVADVHYPLFGLLEPHEEAACGFVGDGVFVCFLEYRARKLPFCIDSEALFELLKGHQPLLGLLLRHLFRNVLVVPFLMRRPDGGCD